MVGFGSDWVNIVPAATVGGPPRHARGGGYPNRRRCSADVAQCWLCSQLPCPPPPCLLRAWLPALRFASMPSCLPAFLPPSSALSTSVPARRRNHTHHVRAPPPLPAPPAPSCPAAKRRSHIPAGTSVAAALVGGMARPMLAAAVDERVKEAILQDSFPAPSADQQACAAGEARAAAQGQCDSASAAVGSSSPVDPAHALGASVGCSGLLPVVWRGGCRQGGEQHDSDQRGLVSRAAQCHADAPQHLRRNKLPPNSQFWSQCKWRRRGS